MAKKQQPRRVKHVPQRTCVACREKDDKRSLLRLVMVVDEAGNAGITIDPTGKQNGRGAYLCQKPTCWDKVLNTPVLAKALRAPLSAADKAMIAANRPIKLEIGD
jgi:predicted RNA-binding protein YlxR (DUF448 family)